MTDGNFTGSLTGTIDARVTARGSKSEKPSYFILFDKPIKVAGTLFAARRLELIGENPFEQPTLKSLLGKRIRATGGYWRGDLWRADAIEEIAPLPKKTKKKRPKRSPPRTK